MGWRDGRGEEEGSSGVICMGWDEEDGRGRSRRGEEERA